MKYDNEFIKANGNKQKFIELMNIKYGKLIKSSTIERRFYDCQKNIKFYPKFSVDEMEKPNVIKMIELEDMIRFNRKITRKYLMKYNFTSYQINWLEEEGYLNDK